MIKKGYKATGGEISSMERLAAAYYKKVYLPVEEEVYNDKNYIHDEEPGSTYFEGDHFALANEAYAKALTEKKKTQEQTA